MTPRALNAADRGAGPYLWRFTPLQRILHGMVVVSFFGLAITGLPLVGTRWVPGRGREL